MEVAQDNITSPNNSSDVDHLNHDHVDLDYEYFTTDNSDSIG